MNVGSLFAGVGGFDLGFERAGMRTLWQVEQNPYRRAVLARHFPDAERFEDVREVGVHNLAPVDLICGGFPCQDISLAGKGAGLAGARSGLWSEYARIVGELRPRWVVVENVPALRRRGLSQVLADLDSCGYDAEWDGIPASAVGAPHRRDRIWLVAYPSEGAARGEAGERSPVRGSELGNYGSLRDVAQPGIGGRLADTNGFGGATGGEAGDVARAPRAAEGNGQQRQRGGDAADHRGADVADASRDAEERPEAQAGAVGERARPGGESAGELADADSARRKNAEGGEGSPRTQGRPLVGADNDPHGAYDWLSEPDVGRVADGVPSRVDRLSALGDALIPQIAEWIGQRIVAWEEGVR